MICRTLHAVSASVGGFGDRVAPIGDIDIISCPANQRVSTCAAVQDVGCPISGDPIGECVACPIDCGSAGQGQVFDIGCQRIAGRAVDLIGPGIGRLGNRVAAVDGVGVVPATADQRVGSGARVQGVVPCLTDDRVIARIAPQDVVSSIAPDRVVA